MLTMQKILDAGQTIAPVIRRTDLIAATSMFKTSEVYLKCENLQVTGSFKVRGSCNKILNLSEAEKQQGVIACSAGNHAQGVALAAKLGGIKATICIPAVAPLSKIEATRSYGAEVVLVDGVYDDAAAKAAQLQAVSGATFIHPFDDEDVIAGQGTIGLEILEQLEDVDAVIVPIGGGGLISGVAYAIKTLRPQCQVYGVQAEGAPGMVFSVTNRCVSQLDCVATVADGIAVKRPGELTYQICEKYVDGIVTVTDDEIATAMLYLMEKQKLVAEGAGAVSVAAALFNKVDLEHKKTVCIISGGNVDVSILSRAINKGLIKTGRKVELHVQLPDKPGQISAVTALVAKTGANVVSIHHDRAGEDLELSTCMLHIELETRDHEHIVEIKRLLKAGGFRLL